MAAAASPGQLGKGRRQPIGAKLGNQSTSPMRAYLLKEELGELWQQDDGRRAWAFLREWAAKATDSGIRHLQAMAKTLLRQAKGILSFYHTGLTSGKMEGINRKS